MCRVSSDEQAKGFSLDVQKERLVQHCRSKGIHVVDVIWEDHSAKDFNRPEFQKFLTKVKASKNYCDYLFFTTWDRFSRNATDALNMIRFFQSKDIELLAIDQPLDLAVPENKMMLAMYLMMPEIDNDRRSIKIREGMREALKQGRWCRKAPVGYRNVRNEKNEPIIVLSDKATFIKQLYRKVRDGIAPEVARKQLMEKGFKISNSHVYTVLSHIIYTGKLLVPAEGDEPAQIVNAEHEGIISIELFNQVQQRMFPNRKEGKPVLRKTFNEALPFRGLLICPNCGEKMTGSLSRSRNGKRHAYYHCNKCRKTRMPAHQVEKNLVKVLNQFEFESGARKLYKRIIEDVLNERSGDRKADFKQLLNEQIDLDLKIKKTQDLFADGKLEYQDYKEMLHRYRERLTEVEKELKENKADKTQMKANLNQGVNLLSNLPEAFAGLHPRGKLQLLRSIFPEDLEVLEKSCRTPRINKVLAALLTVSGEQRTTKKGQIVPFLSCSSLVENTGVEPVTS